MRLPFWPPLLLVLARGGCCGQDPVTDDDDEETPPMEDRDFVGKDALVSPGTLRFTDGATGARFHKLRACFLGLGSGEGWSHYPLRKLGNFIQEDWCRGPGSHTGCAGGNFRETRDVDWRTLHTLHYESSWPDVFGLGVGAGHLPAEGDWGASIAYYAGGQGITGASTHVNFHRLGETRVEGSIHLGSAYAYDVEEAHLTVIAPGAQDEELERLFASPESLRDTALERFDALLVEVERAIDAGEVQRCEYGEYHNDGIPPECTLKALTTAEREAAIEKAREEIGGWRRDVEQHHTLLHGLLTDLLDLEGCW